jgi:tRNA (guanine-N7-)-methyltransferase
MIRSDLSATPKTRSEMHLGEMQRRRELLVMELRGLFAQSSRFTWEVGCGHGHFLSAYARAHPGKLCIGVDIVSERIERALRKRDRSRLENLFFIRAEARLFLEALPSNASFDELFILFPDPWPKLRHRKHRILQFEFLSAAAARAVENSQLCFRTDHAPYFHQAQDVLGRHPQWRPSMEPWPFEFCTVFQSRAAEYHSLIGRRTETPVTGH